MMADRNLAELMQPDEEPAVVPAPGLAIGERRVRIAG
jgi:hypothetical protein